MPNPSQNITDLFGDNKEAASQQLDQFVSKGMKLLYSDDTIEDVINTLKSDPDPVKSISRVTVGIVQRLDTAARNAGDEGGPSLSGKETVRGCRTRVAAT